MTKPDMRGLAAKALLAVSAACFAGLSAGWIYDDEMTGMPKLWLLVLVMVLASGTCTLALKFWPGFRDMARTGLLPGCASLAPAVYTAWAYGARYGGGLVRNGGFHPAVPAGMAVLAVPMLWLFFTAAYKILARVLRRIGRPDRYEAVFLACFCAAAFAFSAWAFHTAPILYNGSAYGGVMADIVYLFDSPYHMFRDSFFMIGGVENDFRNLFFGLFSMPVSAPCHMLAGAVRAVSGYDAYPLLLAWSQCLAMGASILLFARCAAGGRLGRVGLCILFTCSYQYMLHTIVLEQYAFPLFWAAALAYLHSCGRGGAESDACLAFATGGLTSSAVLACPVLLDGRERASDVIRNVFLGLAAALCLSGQVAGAARAVKILPSMGAFFGFGLPISDVAKEFTVFVKSILLQPDVAAFSVRPWDGLECGNFSAYRLSNDLRVDFAGIALIAAAAAGAVLNRKDRFCRMCAWWAGASVVILAVFGWGTFENGLVIYGLHFGWAYLCLAFKLAERMLGKKPWVLLSACAAAGCAMALANAAGLRVLFGFLSKYYPA